MSSESALEHGMCEGAGGGEGRHSECIGREGGGAGQDCCGSLSRYEQCVFFPLLNCSLSHTPSKTGFMVSVHRLINITLLTLVKASSKGGRRPIWLRTHTQ